jgi:hypothetical protein
MVSVTIDSIDQVRNIDPITINPLTINPLNINPFVIDSIRRIEKIAPAAVHIKELNQIAPISVDSLRVDHVRHVDPLQIDRLNVTNLPTVNLSLSQLPALDLNVRRVPPITIALGQRLELSSNYTIRARLMSFEILRLEVDGKTKVAPQDCARREQSRTHERSFPEVAAAGNPAIPTKVHHRCCEAVTRTVAHAPPPDARAAAAARSRPPPWPAAPGSRMHAGTPRFQYGVSAAARPSPNASTVGSGD